MQFYISVMFLGLPDDIHEEKPSFLQSKKNALWTDGPTDGPTEPLIKMLDAFKKISSTKL